MGTRRVLVTGCSSGIGMAVAVRLAKEKGFKVVATMRDLEKREPLERVAGDTLNRSLEIRQLDACCEDSIRECVDSLQDRRVDVLVSNAGVGMIGPLECHSVSDMQGLFDTNFFGLVRLVKEVLPDMKRRRSGHIVVMSSIMGIQVEPGPVGTEFERKVYEDAEKMDLAGADEETARIFREIYLPYSRKVFNTLAQTPEEIAEQTLQLITVKEPPFRHQTNRVYMPMTALKHADPTGRLPLDTFYKLLFKHDSLFTASLGLLRMLQKRTGKSSN
ncbi:retinol dehydrogenase 8 isoform X2 [Salvelinus namaycush]|uniref:Retinol dehydrogenase 8 isoform X2 n=1 Tax=Salvelinus namaycush TaxID=8040 RepID=A0A8U0QA06_SALNM|nr:retinol dehydrogenase 8 isoform X2 [Salvelinus namaycush]